MQLCSDEEEENPIVKSLRMIYFTPFIELVLLLNMAVAKSPKLNKLLTK